MMPASPIITLMGEIAETGRLIASLPPCSTREELMFKAKHQKVLGEKLEEYDLFIETQRRATAVREHQELYPPNTEECPICLETIPIVSAASIVNFVCCGNGMCRTCSENIRQRQQQEDENSVMPTCPMCRAEFPQSEQEGASLLKQRAKDGKSWAQSEVGRKYRDGVDGYPVDEVEALKMLELAASQHNPVALYEIYQIRYEGLDRAISGVSLEKAMALLKESADLGYFPAQSRLGEISYSGMGGPIDMSKAAYYFTLAYSQDPHPPVAFYLGVLFLEGWEGGPADGGFEKSLYRAKFYLEEALEGGFVQANTPLGATLQELCTFQYNGLNALPGYSSIPRARACFQKGVGIGDPRAKPYLDGIEKNAQNVCSNCDKFANRVPGGKLSRCKRCKAVWYCGRDCQVKHWKIGHKIDCVKQEW